MKNNYQAFFFDFDGVLVDSFEIKTKAFAMLYRGFGEDVVERVVSHHRNHGGVTREKKIRYYHKEFLGRTLGEEDLKKLCKDFSKLVFAEIVSAPEIPGARKFLMKCYLKIPCFVISGTPQKELHEIIARRGLGIYFQKVFGAPMTKEEGTRKIISEYRFDPQRCIFWGDALADHKAAVACNVLFRGIVPSPDAPLVLSVPELVWCKNFLFAESII